MKQKTLQKSSKYEQYDIDGESDRDWETIKPNQ